MTIRVSTEIMTIQEFIKAAWAKVAFDKDANDFLSIRHVAITISSSILQKHLLSCPFCGTTSDYAKGVKIDGESGLLHYISCQQCQSLGRKISEGDELINMELVASCKLMDERFALDDWEDDSNFDDEDDRKDVMRCFVIMRTAIAIYYAARYWNTRKVS